MGGSVIVVLISVVEVPCLLGMLNVKCCGGESWVWTGAWWRYPRLAWCSPSSSARWMLNLTLHFCFIYLMAICMSMHIMYTRLMSKFTIWLHEEKRGLEDVSGSKVLFFITWGREDSRGLATSPWLRSSLSLPGCVSRAAPTTPPRHTASSPAQLAAAAVGSITHSCACSFQCWHIESDSRKVLSFTRPSIKLILIYSFMSPYNWC